MLHVMINGTRFNLSTPQKPDQPTRGLIEKAQDAMDETSTAVLDSDGDETGFDLPAEIEPQAWALAEALEISVLSNIGYDGRGYGPDVWSSDDAPGGYWVLDESERDEQVDDQLDDQLDEIISDLPVSLSDYIDRDRWKEDQIDEIEAGEGYGSFLASYDGQEREACIDRTRYYVYRVG